MSDARPAPRGRPRAISAHELQLVALRLFADEGFEETTVQQIAAAAGVSERTFFRYFTSKANVVWTPFETEVETLRADLGSVADDVPMMDAIRLAVIAANHHDPAEAPQTRMLMNLVTSSPALFAAAAQHFDAWERVIADFAATRLELPADSLFPLLIGRTTLAASRSAHDQWAAHAHTDLSIYLDAALRALAAGFSPAATSGFTAGSDD